MGFRDFISNAWYRRQVGADFERYRRIKPPSKPSRRYIDKLVRRLLTAETAWDARKEISLMGDVAVPSLVAALGDTRFHVVEWDRVMISPPFEAVLELLVPHAPLDVIAATAPQICSESERMRRVVALNLASVGTAEVLPFLARLLQDTDEHVRSQVALGVGHALSDGRASAEFRQGMYDLLLAHCDQHSSLGGSRIPEVVVSLDKARASVDFASARWLSIDNPEVPSILEACNKAGILLPEDIVRPLFEGSLQLAVGEPCYPHQYIAAAALEALTLQQGDATRPLLQAALDHEQTEIQNAAARGLAKLAGLDEPVKYTLERANEVAFERLTGPQQVLLCAFLFDAEVCNGGIMQFFGNCSGEYAAETLEALRTIGHPEAEHVLAAAMEAVGPLARERDTELRMSAFADRYDELQEIFAPLETAFYRTSGRLMPKAIMYAVDHAQDFFG